MLCFPKVSHVIILQRIVLSNFVLFVCIPKNIKLNKSLSFTLGSIYSTSSSGAEQMPETN